MGRQGRRRKRLLDDLKETREYSKLKKEAIDGILCGTRLEEAVDLSYGRLLTDIRAFYRSWFQVYSTNITQLHLPVRTVYLGINLFAEFTAKL
jgi:hypothetical protein